MSKPWSTVTYVGAFGAGRFPPGSDTGRAVAVGAASAAAVRAAAVMRVRREVCTVAPSSGGGLDDETVLQAGRGSVSGRFITGV